MCCDLSFLSEVPPPHYYVCMHSVAKITMKVFKHWQIKIQLIDLNTCELINLIKLVTLAIIGNHCFPLQLASVCGILFIQTYHDVRILYSNMIYCTCTPWLKLVSVTFLFINSTASMESLGTNLVNNYVIRNECFTNKREDLHRRVQLSQCKYSIVFKVPDPLYTRGLSLTYI